MEKESFEDEEIAVYLNEHYPVIKVIVVKNASDLDAVYRAAVSARTAAMIGVANHYAVTIVTAMMPFRTNHE